MAGIRSGYRDQCRSCVHWSPMKRFEGKPVEGVGWCETQGRPLRGNLDACPWYGFRAKAFVKAQDYGKREELV